MSTRHRGKASSVQDSADTMKMFKSAETTDDLLRTSTILMLFPLPITFRHLCYIIKTQKPKKRQNWVGWLRAALLPWSGVPIQSYFFVTLIFSFG
ncbi:hypothetical protein ACTXT7_003828 [Hymenolepis weldensis]